MELGYFRKLQYITHCKAYSDSVQRASRVPHFVIFYVPLAECEGHCPVGAFTPVPGPELSGAGYHEGYLPLDPD